MSGFDALLPWRPRRYALEVRVTMIRGVSPFPLYNYLVAVKGVYFFGIYTDHSLVHFRSTLSPLRIKCHHAADAVSPLSSCIFVEIHTTGYERTLGGRITHTPQYYFFRKGFANNPSPFAHRGLFVVQALTRVSAGAHNNMGFPSSRNKHLTRPRAARCSRLYINLSSRTPHRRTSPNALNAQNFCLRTAGQSGRLAFKRSS